MTATHNVALDLQNACDALMRQVESGDTVSVKLDRHPEGGMRATYEDAGELVYVVRPLLDDAIIELARELGFDI